MKKQKPVIKISDLLTPAECNMLQDCFNAKQIELSKQEDNVRVYINKGIEFGLIGQSGEKYIDSRPLYEMRDSILDKIKEEKKKYNDLFLKLVR